MHDLISKDPSDKISIICNIFIADKFANFLNKEIKQSFPKEKDTKPKTADITGGTLVIPDGYFICAVDLDDEVPFCIICDNETMEDERTLEIPKSLAHYLSTQHNGSNKLREHLILNAQNIIRDKLRELLGHSDETLER
jgi:hypothetical protein